MLWIPPFKSKFVVSSFGSVRLSQASPRPKTKIRVDPLNSFQNEGVEAKGISGHALGMASSPLDAPGRPLALKSSTNGFKLFVPQSSVLQEKILICLRVFFYFLI